MSDRHESALHEAAHGVVALSLGGDVESLDIHQCDGRNGRCLYVPPPGIVNRIAVIVAGALAEHEARLRRGQKYDFGASRDLADVKALLAKRYGRAMELADCGEFREAEALARRTIQNNWGVVWRIRERLLTHSAVSGALATAIFLAHKQRRA